MCPYDNISYTLVKTMHFCKKWKLLLIRPKISTNRKAWHILNMFKTCLKLVLQIQLVKWMSVKEIELVKISITSELNQSINPVLDLCWTSTVAINPFSETSASLVFHLQFFVCWSQRQISQLGKNFSYYINCYHVFVFFFILSKGKKNPKSNKALFFLLISFKGYWGSGGINWW